MASLPGVQLKLDITAQPTYKSSTWLYYVFLAVDLDLVDVHTFIYML